MEAQGKLKEERESAEKAFEVAFAKLQRLRKQERLLETRSSELFQRGMRELDEEDGVRTQEEALLEEQQAVGDVQSLGAFGVIDWTASGFDFNDLGSLVPEESGAQMGESVG